MKSNNRIEFLKKSALASAAAITLPSWFSWTRDPMTSPTKIGEKKNGMLTSGI